MFRFCKASARRVLVWTLHAAVLVLLCVGSFGTTGAASEDGGYMGVAPAWPFRGVVHYGGRVLEYRSAESGEVRRVWIGGPHGCPSPVAGNEEYVEVSGWAPGGGPDVILRVPWGDEAYPYFAWSEDVPGRYFKRARDVGVEVSAVPGGFRVATAEREAYYHRPDDGGPRLVRTGGSLGQHLEAVGVESEKDFDFGWHYLVQFDGTDGFHYGFRLVHPEPNCRWEEGFIVAGDTGEVVVCGLGRGGAWLVLPEGSPRSVERYMLPQWSDCDWGDIWHARLGGLSSDSGG